MPVKSVSRDGKELQVGDKVKCIDDYLMKGIMRVGCTYTVSEIMHSNCVRIEGLNVRLYSANRFEFVSRMETKETANPTVTRSDVAQKIADDILYLINSQPYTPTRDQIIAIIKSNIIIC